MLRKRACVYGPALQERLRHLLALRSRKGLQRHAHPKRRGDLGERAEGGIDVSDDGTRRYNIAPTEKVLAIIAPKGEREARLLRWGLVPSYATDLKSSYKMINARIETVTTNAAYRRLIGRAARRALQVADG